MADAAPPVPGTPTPGPPQPTFHGLPLAERDEGTEGAALTPEDILGPRPEAPPPGPGSAASPEEAILGPRPAPRAFGQVYGSPIWTGPDADQYYNIAQPIAHVLGAIGQGAMEAWDNGKNLGFSDDINDFMRKAGIYNDVTKGQGSVLRTYNEALMRPLIAGTFGAFGAAFRGLGAAYTGAFAGLGQVAEEAGSPLAARDITAVPEAFPLFGHEIGIPALVPGELPGRHEIEAGVVGAKMALAPVTQLPDIVVKASRNALAGYAMRTGPLTLPEVNDAAYLGVIGPQGKAGWDGTAAYPSEQFPMGATTGYGGPVEATQGSIPAQYIPPPPRDIHEAARRVAPDVFEQYDAASREKDALRERIAVETAGLRQNAEMQAPGAQEIIDLQDRMETATPRLAKKYQARIEALREEHEAFLGDEFTMRALTRDTEEITAAREGIQAADIRMRDLAEQVSAAYRVAAERYPETQRPVEPEALPPAPVVAAAPETAAPVAEVPMPTAVLAGQPAPPPAFSIAADKAAQLIAAGRPREEAEAAGQLVESHYVARAARFGGTRGTAEEMYRADASQVRGQGAPPAPTAPTGRIPPSEGGGLRSVATIQADEKVSARKAKQIWEQEVAARAAYDAAHPGERAAAARARPVTPAPVREPAMAEAALAPAAVPAPVPAAVSRETMPETTPGAITEADQAALAAAVAQAREVTPEEIAARRRATEERAARRAEMRRNAEMERLAQDAGVPEATPPEQVAAEVVERLPERRVVAEIESNAEVADTDYREAEAAAKKAVEAKGEEFKPEEVYDADQNRSLEELESEHRPPDEAIAAQQRAGGGGEPEPAAEGPRPVSEGGGPPGRVAEPTGRAPEETAAAGEPATTGAGEPGAEPVRQLDGRGNPIFQKGERVVIPEGQFAGRHGTVDEAVGMRMQPIFGGQATEANYHYTVRTDGGTLAMGVRLEPEVGEAPPHVPDPRYEGHAIDPDSLQRSIQYDRQNAEKADRTAARARSPRGRAAANAQAVTARMAARAKRTVLDQWKAEHPEEAARVLGAQAAPAAPEPAVAEPTAEPQMTIIETRHTKENYPIWAVSLSGPRLENEPFAEMKQAAKEGGGYWSSFRGQGAVPGFLFRSRADAEAFVERYRAPTPEAPVAAPAPRAAEAPPEQDHETWWDRDLTQYGRRMVLNRASVNLPDRVQWRHIGEADREKLIQARAVIDPAAYGRDLSHFPGGQNGLIQYVRDMIARGETPDAGDLAYRSGTSEGYFSQIIIPEAQKSPEARAVADAVAPAQGKGPLPVTTAVAEERAPPVAGSIGAWANEVAAAFKKGGTEAAQAEFKRIFDENEGLGPKDTLDFQRASHAAMREAGWKGGKEEPAPEPAPAEPPPTAEPTAPGYGEANKVFTKERADRAREILRRKAQELRTGIDPEMMMAGIDLAGYHIEAGARSFANFAKAMVEEIGEQFRPYLRSWYEGARYHPGFDARGMSDAAEIEAETARWAKEPEGPLPRITQADRVDGDRLLEGHRGQPIVDEIAHDLATGLTPEEIAVERPSETLSPAEVHLVADALERHGEVPELEEEEGGVQGPIRPGYEGAGAEGVHGAPAVGEVGRVPAPEERGGPPAAEGVAGGQAEERARELQRIRSEERGGAGAGDTDRLSAAAEGSTPGAAGRYSDRPDATVKGENYRIEPGALAEGRGQMQKARDNVAAIELVKRLEAEGRPATKAEQSILARYVGWGGIKGAFRDSAGDFGTGLETIGARLETLLSKEEHETAARSVQYAHYTAEHVINSMWEAVRRMGFQGGMVFEPGMGIGHFLGLMPGDLAEKSQYQGLEMDHLTASIAKLLYPESGVRQADYTRTTMPRDTFDLVIGNPPFSATVIRADPRYAANRFMMHDYFFAKSLDSVRPGGLLGFVTSAGTMNKLDTAARDYLAERAEFVGGIRLPDTAFQRNAMTSVTTDILFFKRRPEGRVILPEDQRPAWAETVMRTLPDKEGTPFEGNVSRYFSEHPENVLGREDFANRLQPAADYAVHQEPGTDLAADLRAAVERLPENVMDPPITPEARAALDFESGQRKDGSFYIADDGRLMQYREGAGREVPKRGGGSGGLSAGERERVQHLVPMRDALRDVFAADLARDEEAGAAARERLNEHYDRFVEKFGAINKAEIRYQRPSPVQQETARLEAREEARFAGDYWNDGDFDPSAMIAAKATMTDIAKARQAAREQAEAAGRRFDEGSFDPADMQDNVNIKRPNIRPFMADPESYRMRSIEHYDDFTGEFGKKEIFYRSILHHEEEPDIRSANDGVLWSMNQFGRFDLDRIAEKMGRDPASIVGELGDSVFKVPGKDIYQTKDEYLSGDVVSKLEEARTAAEHDPEVRRNIAALEAAIPPPLAPSEISMFIGMPWIPAETVSEFVRDHMELGSPRINHSEITGGWAVDAGDVRSYRFRAPPGFAKWGIEDRNAYELLSDAMNRTPPRIYQWEGSGTDRHRVFDEVATQAAQDKVNQIKEEFANWITSDQDRADGLAQLYNDSLNRTVLRQYDGSYLTTPGVASDFKWRPHQTRVIARIIADGNTYMAHAPGAGKTAASIGAGMEMRRLGLIKKPLYVVPGHVLGQFTKEFYEQYPTARVAVADEERFHTSRRKQFVANVAQDDLDAIIMSHSSFEKIPISDGFQQHLLEEQIDQYREALEQMDPEGERISVRRIQKAIEALEQKLSAGTSATKDQTLTFEEMGVDHLFVDEAHMFRKLSFGTRQASMKGISPEGSNRAWDMYAKVRYLDSLNPGRSHVFMSGTPITNTMGELYTLSRFMQPQALAKRGLSHFDSWAQTFGDTKTGLEETAAGTYQPVTRFGSFVNLPELYKMVGENMDIVTPNDLAQYVTLPKLKNGERQLHLAPRSEILDEYQRGLARRMEAIKARRGPPQKGDDILLSVINDGRHAAIDPRYVAETHSDPTSKLNMMLSNVVRIYHETADKQFYDPGTDYQTPSFKGPATQMIFANMGVNGRGPMGFSGYQWIKEALRREGIPNEHIAFIGDYEGMLKRQTLFNDMNEGKVRILIGSTQKMGTGVNAQRRMVALHNEDPLWYPADDEQRNARMVRQGNHNPEVEVHDYVTKGTYDSAMYRMMGNKARFIEQFFRGDPNLRTMEDIGEASMYEQASAIATTDERLITLTQMKQDLELARRREMAHDREQYSLRNKLRYNEDQAKWYSARADSIRQDIATREDTTGDKFSMIVAGETFTTRKAASEALAATIEERGAGLGKGASTTVGKIGGFPMAIKRNSFNDSLEVSLKGFGGREIEVARDNPVASAEHVLRNLEGDEQRNANNAAKSQQDADAIRPLIGKVFEGTGDILRLAKQVRDLEEEIAPKKEADAGLPPRETEEAAPEEEPRTLYQRAQGKITLGARKVITLMRNADASTFIHETGHDWLEELVADAQHPNAPEDLIADEATVRRWLRSEPGAPITTAQHEKFARGFERYLMEGVAPTRNLARVFAQFRQWLTAIYQTVTRLRAPITDDIRRVFDRLVATPEQRTVLAPEAPEAAAPLPEPEVGAKVAADLAALHEQDAQHTPEAEAAPAAEQAHGERIRTVGTHAPEVADELAGRRPGEEVGAGEERAPGAAGNVPRGGAVGGEEADAARLREERGGRGGAVGEGTKPPATPEQPASPYGEIEEPEKFVDKAGNIRLDNLNAAEDVKEVLRELARKNDDFMVARGGVIPIVQRRAMADALGLTVDTFSPQKPDGVSPSVWADAVQKLTFQASDEAAQAARIAGETGTPEDIGNYVVAKTRLLMIADHFAGVTAEAGRTLQVFDKRNMKFVGDLVATMERDTGRTLYQLQQEARAVGAMDTTAQRSRMIQDTRQLTYPQAIKRGILAYFINNLISGPITHTSYSIGNAVWATFKATALTAAEAATSHVRVMFGGDPADRIYYGEIGAQLYGMMHGARDGVVPGWKAVQSGISYMEGAEKLAELSGRGVGAGGLRAGVSPLGEAAMRAQSITGPYGLTQAGRVLETPSRVVAGIHTLFYSMSYEREIARLAYRQAANEGLTGWEFSNRVADITQNPPEEMIQAAHDEALGAVLMKRPDYGSKQYLFARAVNQSFPAKLMMPFMQIGVNILNEGLIKSTPLGLASQTVRDNLFGRNGEVAQSQQYARIMVGSGISAGIMGLTSQGLVTGTGPADPRELALLEATGWKANSFRIGEHYVPYMKFLGPLGPLVAVSADVHDVASLATHGELGKAVGSVVLGFSAVVADQTWMTGISSFIDAMRHWDRQGDRYVRNLALDFMPFSVGTTQVARMVDQYQREVHSWTDAIRNKLPGLSQGLYPQRDWTGTPIASHTMVSPTTARRDRTMDQMLAVEFYPAKLRRDIRGVPLTAKQYDDYARVAGQLAKTRLDALVNSPGFTKQPAGYQQRAMEQTLANSREIASSWVMMQPGNENIMRQSNAAKLAQMQGASRIEVRAARQKAVP